MPDGRGDALGNFEYVHANAMGFHKGDGEDEAMWGGFAGHAGLYIGARDWQEG